MIVLLDHFGTLAKILHTVEKDSIQWTKTDGSGDEECHLYFAKFTITLNSQLVVAIFTCCGNFTLIVRSLFIHPLQQFAVIQQVTKSELKER